MVHGDALLDFVNAAMGDDPIALCAARQALAEALGAAAVVDAAAVIGTFNQMDRIADGTGIPLDPVLDRLSVELRERIGANAFASAANTPPSGDR